LDLEATVRSTVPISVAISSGSTSWDGRAEIQSVSGHLSSDDVAYDVKAGPAFLVGKLQAQLTVRSESDAADMLLTGDLRETTLSATIVPRSPILGEWPSWAVGMLGAVLGGTVLVGGWAITRNRRARRPSTGVGVDHPLDLIEADPNARSTIVLLHAHQAGPSLEECLERVALAVETLDWANAFHWMSLARQLEPRSAEFCRAQANYLGRLGRFDAAVGACEEAAELGDPEAAVDAAYWSLQEGSIEDAMRFARQAVDRDVRNVEELEHASAFQILRGAPAYDEMIRTAKARLAEKRPAQSREP
jgi:hypothetical protein